MTCVRRAEKASKIPPSVCCPTMNGPSSPMLLKGDTILVAAHGNSLRALIMELEQLSREQVLELNIPTGAPLLYELDQTGKAVDHRYL